MTTWAAPTPRNRCTIPFTARRWWTLLSRPGSRGILICGTGLGMSIMANRFPGIRAALCHDIFTAIMSRRHNDANLLVMGGRVIGPDLGKEIVRAWLTTTFEGGRHQERLDLLEQLARRHTPPSGPMMMDDLARTDPEIYAVIERELQRQLNKLEMIASENFVSAAVLEAQGSILTHKYAEGYPGGAITAAASMWIPPKTWP